MKVITYKCDLCFQVRETDELIGLLEVSGDLERSPCEEAERHVCLDCATILQEFSPITSRYQPE